MMAWVALILWPFIATVFYRIWSLPVAVAATLVGGYLLLPTETAIDLPILPEINKHSIPAFTALLLTILAGRSREYSHLVLPGWLPTSIMCRVLLAFLLLGAFGTVLDNTSGRNLATRTQPGLDLYDAFAIGLGILVMLIPFFLGRKCFATRQSQAALILVLVSAASAYALLALWEVRMSPQLNKQLYGFFPHSWRQHLRGDGFRPVVFLEHGLWLAIFLSSATVAAFGMVRARQGRERKLYAAAGVWLLATLFFSKALGAWVITLALVPIALFLPRRLQILAAASIAVLVLVYPALRTADLVPTGELVAAAEKIDSARAQSLMFRLENEDMLLEHARQKKVFGWGGWGRNRVFDDSGRDLSTTDGRWVILFGIGGWVRYLGEFGLLTLGILALLFRSKRDVDAMDVALALALAANLVDLLPNSGMSPLTWMLAGALVGRMENSSDIAAPAAAPAIPPDKPVYRRSFLKTQGHEARKDLAPGLARDTSSAFRRTRPVSPRQGKRQS